MNQQNWTIEQIEGGTKITVPADTPDETMEIPPAGSTMTALMAPVRTPTEIMTKARDQAREIAQSRVRSSIYNNLGRAPHVHVHNRLCKTKVPIYSHKPAEGDMQLTAGDRVGFDWIIQKACECGDRIAIDIRRQII